MRSVVLGLAAYASLVSGCAIDPPPERTTRAVSAIEGGETDATDMAVVAIANTTTSELCTGSRLGPNLVLTAAHCVSKTPTIGETCAALLFGGAVGPASLFVTDATTIPESLDGYASVAEIRAVPSPGDSLCDRDVALVFLASADDLGTVTPLVPRIDGPGVGGDPFSAIGYGQSGLSAGIGTRRRLDGLAAVCVPDSNGGAGCNKSYTGAFEWIGHAALAHTGGRPGDSGSPAIAADGEVMGVFLRHLEYPLSSDKRDELVYASLEPHSEFLRDGALHAAALGDYDVPGWAVGDGRDDDGEGTGGCAIAWPDPSKFEVSSSAGAVLAMGVWLALVRRRVRRAASRGGRSSKRTPVAPSS